MANNATLPSREFVPFPRSTAHPAGNLSYVQMFGRNDTAPLRKRTGGARALTNAVSAAEIKWI